MRLCHWGFHAYRTLSVTADRYVDVMGYQPSWTHRRKCKHCGWERSFLVWKYPRVRIDN